MDDTNYTKHKQEYNITQIREKYKSVNIRDNRKINQKNIKCFTNYRKTIDIDQVKKKE